MNKGKFNFEPLCETSEKAEKLFFTKPEIDKISVMTGKHIRDDVRIKPSNLPYCREDELLRIFEIEIHVLPAGYKYYLKTRNPISPDFKESAQAS